MNQRTMMDMLITIGITCYREESWLKECWESVLSQTDPRWDAIMVLDGEADKETKTIFEAIEHPKLQKYALRKNVGPYLTRTLAILNANTEWYAHLDGDDLLPYNAVALIIESIIKDPHAVFVYGDNLCFTGNQSKTHKFRVIDPNEDDLEKICLSVGRQSPIKREEFWRLGGFAPELLNGGADWDFWVGMAEKQARGVRANGAIYKYRLRSGSVKSTRNITHEEIAQVVIDRHPDFFSINRRKENYLSQVYKKMAIEFRNKGKRKTAATYAQKAICLGNKNETLEEILVERKMGIIRYAFRRLAKQRFIRNNMREILNKIHNY